MYQFAICVGLGAIIALCLAIIAFYNKKYCDFIIKSNGKPLRGKDYYYTLRQHYPKATELYEDIIVYIIGHDGLNVLRDSGIIKIKEEANRNNGFNRINERTIYRFTYEP